MNARLVDRYAQLYGVEFVFEAAAADGFTPAELVRLARRLVRIDPGWHFATQEIGETGLRSKVAPQSRIPTP